MNLLKFIFKISLSGTALYALTFYAYVIRTGIKVGYVPYMNHPDVVKTTSESHYNFTLTMFSVMLLTYIVSLLLYVYFRIRKEAIPSNLSSVFIANSIFIVLHLFLDPFFLWFVD